MCGLFAWWPQTVSASDLGHVRDALHCLRERGPDSEGLWVHPDQRAYIGHRRLKITGQNGHQPLWNASKTCIAIVNGEIYDLDQKRAMLESKGYRFQSDSDSELVLAVYEIYGTPGISMLEGEFAFVLWDIEKDCIWAARDRAGVKPLRFIQDERGLAFASEAKAFFEAGWTAKWNEDALAQALSIQYPDPRSTLFEGVEQIAPGESIVFSRKNGAWTRASQMWWNWFPHASSDLLSPTPIEATDELDRALTRAVARRCDTKWPLAVHVSGGLDSSAILALASKLREGDVHAFSVGFEPRDEDGEVQHDECVFAEKTAHQLGVPWSRVEASRSEMLAHWGDAVYRAEGIGINGHLVAKWMLARHIHQAGFRVSLSGEGADEALLGYAFLAAECSNSDAARAKLLSDNPVARGLMLPDGEGVDLSAIERVWGHVPVWLRAKASLGHRLQGLMKDDWRRRVCGPALEKWAVSAHEEDASLDVHRAASSWARLALGGYILPSLADAPEAAWHIQGRVPFLDSDLLETVMKWAPGVVGCPGNAKAPLRSWLMRQGLEDVATRPKHPFQAPPLWGSAKVRQSLRERWSELGYWDHTPFDPDKVIACMDAMDKASAPERQKWEPVIATLLSVEQLVQAFDLKMQ